MREPLVSIVVPTFNRAYCLRQCLDSALAQTHRNLQIVVIDDGSTDETGGVIREHYAGEPRVEYTHQSNAGVTVARNRGLALARGEFIALLDSDDTWQPWKLQAQLKCFAKFPELGMIWTNMRAIDPGGAVVDPAYLKSMYSCYRRFTMSELFSRSVELADVAGGSRLYMGEIFSQMFMGSLVHTSTVLLSRERFATVRGFDESLRRSGEDYDFHLRTCRDGPVGYLDVSSVDYRIGNPDSLTREKLGPIVAQNTLTTIEKAYRNDRERIKLPPSMVKERFAEVYAWLGEKLLDTKNRPQARRQFARSLRMRPTQMRTAGLLALAIVPEAMGNSIRQAYRKLRRKPEAIT